MPPNMLFGILPISADPLVTMKEAQFDCPPLNRFETFWFIHGGSRLLFVLKQTCISLEAVNRGTVTWLMKANVHLFGSRFQCFGSKSICRLKHICNGFK